MVSLGKEKKDFMKDTFSVIANEYESLCFLDSSNQTDKKEVNVEPFQDWLGLYTFKENE